MTKNKIYILSIAAAAILLSGCKQEPTPKLKEAENVYKNIKADVKVQENAPTSAYLFK